MDKDVSRLVLMRTIANCIRHKERDYSPSGIQTIEFRSWLGENQTWVEFDGDRYCVKNGFKSDNLKSIVMEALKQSACHGRVLSTDSGLTLTIYQKPCKDFELLNCTLKKKCDFELAWDMVWKENEEFKTSYLAFDKNTCKEALDFIRGHRKAKSDIKVEVIRERRETPPETKQMLHLMYVDKDNCVCEEKLVFS